MMAGLKMLHVPHKGAPAALTAVIGGECDKASAAWPARCRWCAAAGCALAITSRDRSSALPDIPTVAEAGVPGYSSSWQALLGPARMPRNRRPALSRYRAEREKSEMVKRFNAEGMVALGTTPRELDEHMARELEKWAKVTKAAGLSAQ